MSAAPIDLETEACDPVSDADVRPVGDIVRFEFLCTYCLIGAKSGKEHEPTCRSFGCREGPVECETSLVSESGRFGINIGIIQQDIPDTCAIGIDLAWLFITERLGPETDACIRIKIECGRFQEIVSHIELQGAGALKFDRAAVAFGRLLLAE